MRRVPTKEGRHERYENRARRRNTADSAVSTSVRFALSAYETCDWQRDRIGVSGPASTFPARVDLRRSVLRSGASPAAWIRKRAPSGEGTLTSADRPPLRPLFKGCATSNVVATVMSVESKNKPRIPAMIGSSAALCVRRPRSPADRAVNIE